MSKILKKYPIMAGNYRKWSQNFEIVTYILVLILSPHKFSITKFLFPMKPVYFDISKSTLHVLAVK